MRHRTQCLVRHRWACWKAYLGRPETDLTRGLSLGVLGAALRSIDAEAAILVLEARLAMLQRFWPHSENILIIQGNLGACYSEIGRNDEAVRMLRENYAGNLRESGPDDENTILTGHNLSAVLGKVGRFSEAKTLLRKLLAVARQELGPKDETTMSLATNLARILLQDPGDHTDALEAEQLLADTMNTARHALGPQHPLVVDIGHVLAATRRILAESHP